LQLIRIESMKVVNAAQESQSNEPVERDDGKDCPIGNPQERAKQCKTPVNKLEQLVKRSTDYHITYERNDVGGDAKAKETFGRHDIVCRGCSVTVHDQSVEHKRLTENP
jgi:uncharacterized protein YlxW (UPF0749 family)